MGSGECNAMAERAVGFSFYSLLIFRPEPQQTLSFFFLYLGITYSVGSSSSVNGKLYRSPSTAWSFAFTFSRYSSSSLMRFTQRLLTNCLGCPSWVRTVCQSVAGFSVVVDVSFLRFGIFRLTASQFRRGRSL